MERTLQSSVLRSSIVWFLPLILVISWLFYKNLTTSPQDFSNYYFGAYFQAQGQTGAWWYDPAIFNKQISNAGFQHIFASYSPNPPSVALFFLPLASFSPAIAKIIFNGLSGILLVFFLFRWQKRFEINKKWIVISPILFFRPIDAGFYQGQVYFLLLILLIEGYIFLKKENYAGIAFCWSVAIFLKIFPVILFFYLIITRQFKALIWLAITCTGILLLAVSIQGMEIWLKFFTEILPTASAGEVMDSFAISFQSWNVLLKYLFVYDELANPAPVFGNNEAFYQLSLWLIKALTLTGLLKFILSNRDTYKAFALLLLSGLLLTPVGSVYSLITLSVLLPLLANTEDKTILLGGQKISIPALIRIFSLFLICNIPFHTFTNLPLVFRFTRLFLITVLWLSLIKKEDFSVKWILLSLLILTPLHIRQILKTGHKDNSVYVPIPQKQAMLTGFTVENQKLVYTYLNEKGENKAITDFTIKKLDSKVVTVQNNYQLYYKGNLILSSSDTKKSPLLVNNDTIIYMSGKNRGIGFYALRMIVLKKETHAK
jgi:hypothetical protein